MPKPPGSEEPGTSASASPGTLCSSFLASWISLRLRSDTPPQHSALPDARELCYDRPAVDSGPPLRSQRSGSDEDDTILPSSPRSPSSHRQASVAARGAMGPFQGRVQPIAATTTARVCLVRLRAGSSAARSGPAASRRRTSSSTTNSSPGHHPTEYKITVSR